MKNILFLVMMTASVLSFALAYGQDRQKPGQKGQPLADIMKDSTMVRTLMESIATDNDLRAEMLDKMLKACQTDTAKLMELCRIMLQNEAAQKMLLQAMRSTTKNTAMNAGPEILVKFKKGVKDSQIKEMSAKLGLKQVKEIKPLRLRVFQITSGKDVQEVIESCQNESFVEYAEPNQTFKTKK